MLTGLFSSQTNKTTLTVGVSVSAAELHIVAIDYDNSTVSLSSVSSVPFDPRHALDKQVNDALTAFEKAPCRVSVVLSQDMYHMVQVEKPDVPEEDITTALPWTLGDLVPYDASNIVLDYIDYPVQTRTGAKKIDVFAAEKSSLSAVVESMSKKKGQTLTHIHTKEVLATEMVPDDDYARLLIIQESNSEPFLMIVRSRAIWLSRRLRGFVNKANGNADLSQLSDTLGLEIQRSMDFYESQLKQPPLKEILFKTQFDCMPVIERLKPFQPAAMNVFSPELDLSDVVDSSCHFALASALVAAREAQ
ncbi:agglutinin biogenesis protein MshI [Alteromonas mediterranea]|uniref:agglutinin biogenesis protein MshI n=1 Tax=Alteromonas mediterranea TaxID=314275 RepID=UPI001131CD6B|nr:agglutinin biogenesis protein MshI [Alteromonas mediterranea]QDG37082.1 agglutinin biogenesis protein MshI [Alteromonas mediterranea]